MHKLVERPTRDMVERRYKVFECVDTDPKRAAVVPEKVVDKGNGFPEWDCLLVYYSLRMKIEP
jgi:hypothetical protein